MVAITIRVCLGVHCKQESINTEAEQRQRQKRKALIPHQLCHTVSAASSTNCSGSSNCIRYLCVWVLLTHLYFCLELRAPLAMDATLYAWHGGQHWQGSWMYLTTASKNTCICHHKVLPMLPSCCKCCCMPWRYKRLAPLNSSTASWNLLLQVVPGPYRLLHVKTTTIIEAMCDLGCLL